MPVRPARPESHEPRRGPRRLLAAVCMVGGAAVLVTACTPESKAPLVSQGRRLYVSYCADCHGATGRGDGYNAVHLDPHPRDLTDHDEPYMAGLTNDQIVEAIQKGGRGIDTTPLMPAFGGTFSEEELWAGTAYIRTLHRHTRPPVVVPPSASRERPFRPSVPRSEFQQVIGRVIGTARDKADLTSLAQAGRELFDEEYGCVACHRIAGRGGEIGPDLTRAGTALEPAYVYRWIKNPHAMKPGAKMPNLQVPDRDAAALTLYLTTLR